MPGDLLEQLQSARVDLAFRGCLANRAVRFVRVAAIGEVAFAEVGQKFREVSFHRGKIQMM